VREGEGLYLKKKKRILTGQKSKKGDKTCGLIKAEEKESLSLHCYQHQVEGTLWGKLSPLKENPLILIGVSERGLFSFPRRGRNLISFLGRRYGWRCFAIKSRKIGLLNREKGVGGKRIVLSQKEENSFLSLDEIHWGGREKTHPLILM